MIRSLRNYVFTLRYLSPRQWGYRLIGPLRGFLSQSVYRVRKGRAQRQLSFSEEPLFYSPDSLQTVDGGYCVTCLNRTEVFLPTVDWSFMGNGLLWNYHLHYLNWLQEPETQYERLYGEYVRHGHGRGSSFDPYPTSLRIINTVKAVCAARLSPSKKLISIVERDCAGLLGKLEYHIMGNHLLENGFGLLWGGFFLSDQRVFRIGVRIVLAQLREQILPDGGHFERSPMYHSLMLWRILDSINLLGGTGFPEARGVLFSLRRHARFMAGWLSMYPMTAETGYMNDSTAGMVPDRPSLLQYAERLGITPSEQPLRESGFRTLRSANRHFEILADVGTVSPQYLPGHAHAGTLGFELYYQGKPLLVDTGTSTYQIGARRSLERSTLAHNTVTVGGMDSSEVWAGFRVARRARVTIHCDTQSKLTASHDGYKSRLNVVHTRRWWISDDGLVVKDTLSGRGAKRFGGVARYVFHPDVVVQAHGPNRVQADDFTVMFDGAWRVLIETAQISGGFNTLKNTLAVSVPFTTDLTTRISSC